MIKIFTWNGRGLSNSITIDYIQDIMARLKPNFLCLVETKSNTDRTLRFCNIFKKNWDWAPIPSIGFSGGIIVLWQKFAGVVTPIALSRFALHLIISNANDTWILTTIYN